ncbi:hypothetical protein H2198_007574 [Neophaeococcomyces mojaviensis]|uniref:Uncharacterized protein n=1 Tax=Neophaeococcomyces mojaviensis TaxID=3383035 RepID=A0ACC2ZZR1_9EURO|nr:hypothetical protein H2198_007574 [Knufia sp. JES_112]
MSSTDPTSLTNTLILALTQCQEQLQTIQRQAVRVDRLQQENQRLRRELEDYKSSNTTRVETQPTTDVQDLFQKNIDAQAEIHRLNRKLKAYKEKTNGRLSVPLSSPLPSSPNPAQAPVLNEPDLSNAKRAAPQRSLSPPAGASRSVPPSPPRKRQRANSGGARDVLVEVSVNTLHSRTPSTSASKQSILEKAAAISCIAEDGDDHIPRDMNQKAQPQPISRENSASHRLDALLADPSPVKSSLMRPKPSSPRRATSGTRLSEVKSARISNISHTASLPERADSTPIRPHSRLEEPVSRVRGTARAKVDESSRTPLGSRAGSTSVSRARICRGPEDDEPFRARPLQRLSMHHFKPNPRWLDSHGVSYDEFLHGRQGERIKALAETLPHLPGQNTNGNPMSDHELLLDFLGPGSEERIASLTPAARNNLLLEARTKHVAQAFARQRQDYDKDQDVPGFWMADMPGTQEEEENRAVAKQRERDEVKRRYEDAMSGGGRWIFADE